MLSEKVAGYVIKNKNIVDKDQQEILFFGAQVFFGLISTITITLMVAYAFNLYNIVAYMVLVSIMIRKTAGGAHSDNSYNCLLITVAIYNFIAYIASITINVLQNHIQLLCIFTLLTCFILIYLKAPVESPQKPLSLKQKSILRKLAFLVVFAMFLMVFTLHFDKLIIYAVCLIILWQCLMLTSIGHKIMDLLDKMFFLIYKKEV